MKSLVTRGVQRINKNLVQRYLAEKTCVECCFQQMNRVINHSCPPQDHHATLVRTHYELLSVLSSEWLVKRSVSSAPCAFSHQAKYESSAWAEEIFVSGTGWRKSQNSESNTLPAVFHANAWELPFGHGHTGEKWVGRSTLRAATVHSGRRLQTLRCTNMDY
jgi:hypothetical protein